MKFGVYSSIADPPAGENIARCIEEVLEEAQLAEECGFDSYFFGEHHQDKDGFLPSPLIVATAVAARTRTLQVGTSVILLPLHHPVHLAEDVVTLDQVSQGRIILGVGIGYQPADFRAFDIAMENRVGLFEEGIEVIRQCWTGKPFTFRGEHFNIQDVTVRPAPYQQPSPPLWIGASTMPGARRAGRPGRRLHRRAQHQPGAHPEVGRRLPRVRIEIRTGTQRGVDAGCLGGGNQGTG